MFYNHAVDAIQKLVLSESNADFEPAEETGPTGMPFCPLRNAPRDMAQPPANPSADDLPIYKAAISGGKRIPLLKTVLTSACERNCNYCAFRSGRDTRRFSFVPDEMARVFMQLWQRGAVEGLFLSSAVAGGGLRTQDRLLDTAEILRSQYHFQGYLHLKIMPGAERAQVERAMELADRVSINLEGPTQDRLHQLAPQKILLDELLKPLRWVEEIRRTQSPSKAWLGRWPSSCTQFVVGAVGENDLELLRAADYLHNRLRLARVYYSRFNPVIGTPFENLQAEDTRRQVRLYQASFLLRDYGFKLDDLPFTQTGELPRSSDPKLTWAQTHLQESPVEVNLASQSELIKIPGIGPVSARAILDARRKNPIKSLADLKAIGVSPQRAAPFILLNGRRPDFQPAFF